MTLLLAAIVVLVTGLLGTLFLLFRDRQRDSNVSCYRIGNEHDRHLPTSHQAHVLRLTTGDPKAQNPASRSARKFGARFAPLGEYRRDHPIVPDYPNPILGLSNSAPLDSHPELYAPASCQSLCIG